MIKEVIETLREENAKANKQSIQLMQILVILSAILHLIYFFNPVGDPLLVLFPQDSTNHVDTIPLPRPFTLLSFILHVNLLLLLDPTSFRNILLRMGVELNGNTDFGLYTLSPTLVYSLALVAPAVCIFLRRSWSTICWWSITVVITYAVQMVLESMVRGHEHLSSLEAMRYSVPGA